MKKKLIFGTILAVTLLILASFPSVVSANTEQPNRLYDRIQDIKDRIGNIDWFPGSLIYIFFAFIIIISMMFGFL